MNSGKVNLSWREQRKSVVATSLDDENFVNVYGSIWEACSEICEERGCKRETVRKGIQRAIRLGRSAYGFYWKEKTTN